MPAEPFAVQLGVQLGVQLAVQLAVQIGVPVAPEVALAAAETRGLAEQAERFVDRRAEHSLRQGAGRAWLAGPIPAHRNSRNSGNGQADTGGIYSIDGTAKGRNGRNSCNGHPAESHSLNSGLSLSVFASRSVLLGLFSVLIDLYLPELTLILSPALAA
ncbi:MAG TPA: hypothetical protein V6D23_13775 [Candidatus Obscuribacterales bacterium]